MWTVFTGRDGSDLEFYFEENFPPAWIITILRYWMMTYHVDGFHLVGAAVPSDLVAGDELLCGSENHQFGI